MIFAQEMTRPVFSDQLHGVFNASLLQPSVDLNFLSVVPSGVTLQRSSSAYATGSSGSLDAFGVDEGRIDYLATNLAPLGFLLEPTRTNICLQSEDFSSASWVKTSGISVSSDVDQAPNQTMTADKFAVGTSNFPQVSQIIATPTSLPHSFTIYAKANGINFLQLRVRDPAATSNFFRIDVDLLNGSVPATYVSGNGSLLSFDVVDAGNGWWRFSATGIANTSGSNLQLVLILLKDATGVVATSLNSLATDGVSLWGSQLENASSASSYIPTTISALSRNEDVATVSTSLTSSGTILIKHDVPSGEIILGEGANTVLTSTGAGTLAVSFNATGSQSCLNGGTVSSGSGLTLAGTLRFLGSSVAQSIGHIKRYQEFDKIMSGAELRQISK